MQPVFLPSVTLEEPMKKPFVTQVYCSLGVAISIYHLHRLNWLNWPRWLFTPMLSDYWAELHWVAIPSQRAMSQLLSFSPPRRLQHWAADAVAYGTAGPETLVFLHRGSFLCSHAVFCPAYHLSPFLSKDIHQRNMAPPSLVTPTALCQLSEPERSDCCCRRWRGGYRQHTPTRHTFVYIKIICHFYLGDSLNIQHTKRVLLSSH